MPYKEPLVQRPDPNRIYALREYHPAKLVFTKRTEDTFHVRAVSVWRLSPVVIVVMK